MAQAVLLGQTYGMLSGNPCDLLMAESFHGTIIAWARQAGIFRAKGSLQSVDFPDMGDRESTWRTWARAEETIRVVLALHIHNSQLSAGFHHEPFIWHESGRLSPCCPDQLFAAPTAAQWHAMATSIHPSPASKEPRDSTARATPGEPHPYATIYYAYAVLAGHVSAICDARCGTLSDTCTQDFQHRLASWYKDHYSGIHNPSRDTLWLMVLWHEAFMTLYASMDLLELVVGRDGPQVRDEDAKHVRNWVNEPDGKRCLVHSILIYERLKALPISAEPAIYVPRALFFADLVMYFHVKLGAVEATHSDVDIPELEDFLPQSTADGISTRFDSSMLHGVTGLLCRQGHWGLCRRFASILETLVDDLVDSTMGSSALVDGPS